MGAISVSATSTLPLSYQWFSNTAASNENGTNLGTSNGAQTNAYTPQGSTVSTLYYYCEITNSDGTTKSNVSGLHAVTAPVIVTTGCNDGAFDFGAIHFETTNEYTITGTVDDQPLTQIWSDAVWADNCQKTGFTGDSSGNYNADCRSNPGYSGDLFSWCAVVRYASTLCPGDWRVPTVQDFVDLYNVLGSRAIYTGNYMGTEANQWGGACGGCCSSLGTLYDQGSNAYYWSQTEYSSTNAHYLYLPRAGTIYPQRNKAKSYGYTLRCVRDNQ